MNMRKTILTIFTAACLVFGASASFATEADTSKVGMYIEPKIGVGFNIGSYLDTNGVSRDSASASNTSLNGALAVGYDFYHQFEVPIRAELEYGVRTTAHFDTHGKDILAIAPQTLFANVYWDFRNTTDFTPYIGGGLGASFIGPNSNFAWNAGTGISYALTDDWTASLGYRFVSLGEFENRHTTGIMYSHDINLGIRYTF